MGDTHCGGGGGGGGHPLLSQSSLLYAACDNCNFSHSLSQSLLSDSTWEKVLTLAIGGGAAP